MIRTSVVFLGILALVLAGCSTPRAGILLRAGPQNIDGGIGASQTTGPITVGGVASTDSLGLDTEWVFYPEIDVDWESWHLALDGFFTRYTGSGTADVGLKLGDLDPIIAGSIVDSELDVGYLTLETSYSLWAPGWIDLGIGIGVGVLDYGVDLAATRIPVTYELDGTVPFGYPLLRVGSEVGDFRFLGTLAGLGISYEGTHLSFLEVDARAGYRIFGDADSVAGTLFLGYRYLDFTYEDEQSQSDLTIEVQLNGPYLGFELAF